MKKLAPFLKLYTEYVQNFDKAMDIITSVAAKYPRFMAIMDEIHVSQLLHLVLQSCTILGLLGQLLVHVSNYAKFSTYFIVIGTRVVSRNCVRHTMLNRSSCVAQQHPAKSRAGLI